MTDIKKFRVAFVTEVYWVPDDFIDAGMTDEQVQKEFEEFEPTPEQVWEEAKGFVRDENSVYIMRVPDECLEHTSDDQKPSLECRICGTKSPDTDTVEFFFPEGGQL